MHLLRGACHAFTGGQSCRAALTVIRSAGSANHRASFTSVIISKELLGSNRVLCVARLLVDCNQLAVEIDAEIAVIHNWVRDQYRPKFPELESLVHHPIDYARVVKAIGNEVNG